MLGGGVLGDVLLVLVLDQRRSHGLRKGKVTGLRSRASSEAR